MLTTAQTARLLQKPSTLLVLDGFDPRSETLQGPFQCVGDCITDRHYVAAAYIDSLSVRAGDLGIWFMPSLPCGEQFACKWLVEDSAGFAWLACKFFAVRYRPDFHKAVSRVVAIVLGPEGTFNRPLARRLAREMAGLRRAPPPREDVIVFQEDLLSPESIVTELNRRQQLN